MNAGENSIVIGLAAGNGVGVEANTLFAAFANEDVVKTLQVRSNGFYIELVFDYITEKTYDVAYSAETDSVYIGTTSWSLGLFKINRHIMYSLARKEIDYSLRRRGVWENT